MRRRLISLLLSCTCMQASAACGEPPALRDFASRTYGSQIAFEVLRNGRRVGQHVTRFTPDGAGLTVETTMDLRITFLKIPVHRFHYESSTRWCGERLVTLHASNTTNGVTEQLSAHAVDGALMVSGPHGEFSAAPEILPTDHWNPAVLDDELVLNTLTGRLNRVAISPCRDGAGDGGMAPPGAQCYAYTGDLEKTRSWYVDGRWVGLEFEASDGSTISYVCSGCSGS